MLSKIDRFDTFVAEREANKDWQNFLSRDCSSILRHKIYNHCEFTRSTLYQNPAIKIRLAMLEESLRKRGILVAPSRVDSDLNRPDLIIDGFDREIEILNAKLLNTIQRLQDTKVYIETFL
jgi:hypothetical protein